MATSFNPLALVHDAGSVLSRSGRVATLIGISLIVSGQHRAFAEEPAAAEQQPATESSILIATREVTSTESQREATPNDGDSLEPISQSSDRTPELATIRGEAAAGEAAPSELTVHSEVTVQSQPATSREPNVATKTAPKELAAEPLVKSSIRRAGSDYDAAAPYEPVKFQGILVGTSSKSQVIANWGQPDESVATPEGEVMAFRIHPFEAVEVLVGEGEIISAIKIALTTPLEPEHLAAQLSLDQYPAATVTNEEDQPLGQAFPERGVLFMFDAADSDAVAGDGKAELRVSHVVVQPIAAQAFAMRAENAPEGTCTSVINDLKAAVSLDPKFAHAHFLLAKIYLATGQADLAAASAARACELEPTSAAYQLCRGEAQELLGEYDNAVLTTRAVLDRTEIAEIDKAQALYRMARLASLGDSEIASKAIAFHTRAIEIADKLATSKNGTERRAAKRLLVDAHMAMAEEISRQAFNDKIQTLSLWIGRASGLGEELIENDGGSAELRLSIAQRALGALASFRPTLDPAPWAAEAEEAAQALLLQSDDQLWTARIKWELGIAYFNALRVEHARRETASALKYGQLAVDNLADGAVSRQAVHSSEQLAGQLYFQIGAVYAVHQLDHKKAAQWYDKADALLTGPRPVSELYAPRREGEMLVSMGVTYWQLGEQARALQLTQSGVNLVEMAVEDGILAKSTLAVPYGNLSTMYKNVGEMTNAAKYAELARTVTSGESGMPARLGSTPAERQDLGVRQNIARQAQFGTTLR